MKLISFSPTAWESNSYLLVENGKAMLIDAGASLEKIAEALGREQAELVGILLTHGHFDHILSIDALREKYSVPVYVHEADATMLTDGRLNAFTYFFGRERTWHPAERLLSDKDRIPFGDKKISVISTAGHTRGSVCYLVDDLLFSGDTIFADGYGRTDLSGGNFEELSRSLQTLFTFPKSLRVYSGHGMSATLGDIMRNLGF